MQFQTNIEKYPELYIPRTIVSICNAPVPIPTPPVAPTKPQKPIEPVSNNNTSDIKTAGCFSLFFIVAGIVIFSNLDAFSVGDLFPALPMLIIGGILCILWFFGLLKGDNKKKSEYPQKMIKFKEELRRYPILEKEYGKQWQDYQQKLSRYNDTVAQLTSPMNTKNYRANLLNKFVDTANTLCFQDTDESDKVKRGASENYFLQFLEQMNDIDIYTNCKVSIGHSYYYPDFILCDRKSGLLYDIEIDEPYNGSNGEAIHYIEINYGIKKSIDEKRNEFFTKNNWIVIRFAEQQIFRETESCIEFIVEVMSKIRIADLNSIQIDANLAIDKWTKEQSHLWAYKRYRHSYIPQKYHSFIAVEGWNENDTNKSRVQIGLIKDFKKIQREKETLEKKELLLENSYFSQVMTVAEFKSEMKIQSFELIFIPNPKECGYIHDETGAIIGLISPEICSMEDFKRPAIGITAEGTAVLYDNNSAFDSSTFY